MSSFTPKSVLIVGGLEPFGIGFVNSLYKNYSNTISQIVIFGNPHPETSLNYFTSDILKDQERCKIFYGDNKNKNLLTKIAQDFEVKFDFKTHKRYIKLRWIQSFIYQSDYVILPGKMTIQLRVLEPHCLELQTY